VSSYPKSGEGSTGLLRLRPRCPVYCDKVLGKPPLTRPGAIEPSCMLSVEVGDGP